MTACNNDPEEDDTGTGTGTGGATNTPTSNALGATLNLTGQVSIFSWDGDNPVFIEFTDTRGVFSDDPDIGGEGAINAGLLSFNIGVPKELYSIKRFHYSISNIGANNLRVTPTTARYAELNLRTISDDPPIYGRLLRENNSYSSGTWTDEGVIYIYVDRNVTISADRTVWDFKDEDYSWSATINAFNILLSTGWNAIYYKGISTETENFVTESVTISSSTPDTLKWILRESGGGGQNNMSLPTYNFRQSSILMKLMDRN
jgi:hypothetical protein